MDISLEFNVWISANLDLTANRICFGHIPLYYNSQGWLPQVHCSWYQNWYLHKVPIMLCIWVCLNILWTHKKCNFKSESNDYSNHCFLWGIVVNMLRQITYLLVIYIYITTYPILVGCISHHVAKQSPLYMHILVKFPWVLSSVSNPMNILQNITFISPVICCLNLVRSPRWKLDTELDGEY
jgi:hypothetical protein